MMLHDRLGIPKTEAEKLARDLDIFIKQNCEIDVVINHITTMTSDKKIMTWLGYLAGAFIQDQFKKRRAHV